MMRKTISIAAAAALAACTVGPNYRRPAVAAAAPDWKTPEGWQAAAPADDRPRADWWAVFADPALDALERQVVTANQNVAAAVAAYDQAQAIVRENRAALFPTLGVSAGATRTSSGNSSSGTLIGGTGLTGTSGTGTTGSTGTAGTGNTGSTVVVNNGQNIRLTVAASASWVPDLFGGVRRNIESARASAAASAADLGNVTLAAQGDLATNYFNLRGLDMQAKLYDATVEAYSRSLTITQNRYNAGVAARADLVQAQSQLFGAQANAADLARQRALYENAIAVLVGANPSTFRIPVADWTPAAPPVPRAVPSTLTERRPDIAAAERRVAAANAQVGVQTATLFPSLTLSATGDTVSSAVGSLFAAGTNFWSVGATAAYTLLDFGARRARVAQARALYLQSVATYRQTTLTAFGEVENQLAAVAALGREVALRRAASTAADRAEAIALNQYKSGLIAFTDVVTLQTAALNARLTLVAAQRDRETAVVALIQALGGGWTAAGSARG